MLLFWSRRLGFLLLGAWVLFGTWTWRLALIVGTWALSFRLQVERCTIWFQFKRLQLAHFWEWRNQILVMWAERLWLCFLAAKSSCQSATRKDFGDNSLKRHQELQSGLTEHLEFFTDNLETTWNLESENCDVNWSTTETRMKDFRVVRWLTNYQSSLWVKSTIDFCSQFGNVSTASISNF